MIPEDVKLSDFFGRFSDPLALHDRVTLASGREFGELYLREIKNFRASSRVLNSTIPSRAASTLKLLGVSEDVGVAGAIQNINYVEGFRSTKDRIVPLRS
jgi:protein-disulfide isomerase-like protein with CxxC motif